MISSFRPPSVPLITVDPYFSIWSAADRLYDDDTRHWTNKPHQLTGIVIIDDKRYRFMGKAKGVQIPPLPQSSVTVEPLTSRYVFEGAGIELVAEFTTPLLLDDLELLSRPVTYITFRVRSIDGEIHRTQVYLDLAAEVCVHTTDQEVVWSRKQISGNIEAMLMGTKEQPVLERAGDDTRIDWGYACLAAPHANSIQTVILSGAGRQAFLQGGECGSQDDSDQPRPAADAPTLAVLLAFNQVDDRQQSQFVMAAYDDIQAIEYFGTPLAAYWRRNGVTFEQMLASAVLQYDEIHYKCSEFNAGLMLKGREAGGGQYSDLLALAYRQAIAAHKLVMDEQGDVLFLSKENFSNGCIGTVDVSYPSIPLFLLFQTELVKGMMRPIFRYAGSEAWPFEFAPHDVGCYPKANGQIYGERPGIHRLEDQMPIEECGNMLIMAAAVCTQDNDAEFAASHWKLLSQWAKYLLDNGLDPANQLCTDDFGGHLAHNANLSVKSIVGVGAYSILCGMLGRVEEQSVYENAARRMASEWEAMAQADDHYKLTFDGLPGTWSLKYNLIWDRLLGLELFPKDMADKELAYYQTKRNRYGVPLDNRHTYTKADWLVWSASMAQSKSDFEQGIQPLWDFLNESASRVPFTDWYDTLSGKQMNFQNRSVVGGVFIRLLEPCARASRLE